MLIPHPNACTRMHSHTYAHTRIALVFYPQISLSFRAYKKYTLQHASSHKLWSLAYHYHIAQGALPWKSLDSNDRLFILVCTTSQGERGLPGLPGDMVSTKNRPKGYENYILYRITGLLSNKKHNEAMEMNGIFKKANNNNKKTNMCWRFIFYILSRISDKPCSKWKHISREVPLVEEAKQLIS